MLKSLLFFFAVAMTSLLYAQSDSLRSTNTARQAAVPVAAMPADSVAVSDSVAMVPPVKKLNWQQDTAFTRFFINKNLPKNQQSIFAINAVRRPVQQDEQFYILAGLLLFTGIVRAAFPKYFSTLFQSFFQTAQHQRQSKENITQDALPSFLMNFVFILSGGLLLAVLVGADVGLSHIPFPLLWLYASGALAVVYIVKSLFILFFGWAFGVQEPADAYRYIVFLVNKIAGLCFIPLLLLLIYSSGNDFPVLATIAIALIAILLMYRYILSLSVVGKKLRIHPIHFFLYLCAVEVLPLLITYKVLLITKEL